MSTNYSIDLGTGDRLALLYSYPNSPTGTDTIAHWFGLTLQRVGLAALGATATVRVAASGDYAIDLTGPDNLAASFAEYGNPCAKANTPAQ